MTYGPHVSRYVAARGALNVHEAPQAVDNEFWSASASAVKKEAGERPRANLQSGVSFMFAGRPVWEKGLRVLIQAWRTSGCRALEAALVLVGVGPTPPWVPADGAVTSHPPVGAHDVRNFYGAADVLVVPSIPTRRFREPWGLVVNEAMNQQLPIIATDAVGAAAGGLVRHERNGLIVPAGDAEALSAAMVRLGTDGGLRRRLGTAGAPRCRRVHARRLGRRLLVGAPERRSREDGLIASAAPLMRRLVVTALAAMLLVPSAASADGRRVIRDCTDDGRVQGRYSQSEYRDALAHMPSDVDEYTDCRDVIRRAQLASAGGGKAGKGSGGRQHAGHCSRPLPAPTRLPPQRRRSVRV